MGYLLALRPTANIQTKFYIYSCLQLHMVFNLTKLTEIKEQFQQLNDQHNIVGTDGGMNEVWLYS